MYFLACKTTSQSLTIWVRFFQFHTYYFNYEEQEKKQTVKTNFLKFSNTH